MDQRLPEEIKAVRERMAAIEKERLTLDETDFQRRADLRDEEHDLEARLAHLVKTAASEGDSEADKGEAEKKAAEHTNLTHTPRLPDGASH